MHEEEKKSLQGDNFGIINPLCIRKTIYYRELTLALVVEIINPPWFITGR